MSMFSFFSTNIDELHVRASRDQLANNRNRVIGRSGFGHAFVDESSPISDEVEPRLS